MHKLDIGQLAQIALLTPDGKFHGSTRVSSPGVRILYIGGEDFDEAPRCILVRSEQGRQLQRARFGLY